MEGVGAVVGFTADEAISVLYGAVCVKVVSSPSWICDDDVRGDEGGEKEE